MAARYDDAERTLDLSVRDLVEAGAPTGHLTLEVVQSRVARMAAGREVHTTWQAARALDDAAFRAEVRLKRQLAIGVWTCTVHGRVDGLTEEDGRTVVEEVKSSALDAGRLYASTLSDWSAFVAQLEAYLWMLSEDGYVDPLGRLVLVSLADGAQHVLGVALDAERVRQVIVARLTEMIEARERRITWMSARRAHVVPTPFDAWRDGQRAIAESVQWSLEASNAVLVEAPTGMGKTAAALHGALIYAMQNDMQVFWATARTTQQAGVVAAVERLRRRGLPLRGSVVSARATACINDIVLCRPDACPYADSYFDKVREERIVERLVDQGDPLDVHRFRAIGHEHQVCPFELALDVSSQVDLLVGDYNYALDPGAHLRRHFSEDPSKGWVVVVDEAHQLVERARGWWSPRIETSLAQQAQQRLWLSGSRFRVFVDLAERVDRAVSQVVVGSTGGGEWARADIDDLVFRELASDIEARGLDYALLKADGHSSWGDDEDDAWVALARQVMRFATGLEERGEESVPIVRRGPSPVLQLLCLDPSRHLAPRIARLGGFVGLSATLSPPEFYRDLLGLDPDHLELLTVPGPFPPERRKVLVAPRVSTAFRDRQAHAQPTADLVSRCVRAVPGNVAVYFPSFAMLTDQVARWSLPDREVVVQTPGMDEAARTSQLARLQRDGPPVVLAAVLGGIFAEGIDLPPGALDAVVVAGPALPPIGLERDLLRAYYEERYGEGFRYASLIPGMTRVIQAAGRLIRRPEDRGVVLLLGRRFRWRDISALLPEGWKVDVVDGDPAAEVAAFFSAEGEPG